MELNKSNFFRFKDLNPIEKRSYIHTLAKIFARRVIIEHKEVFFLNLKDLDIRTNDGIPDNFILSGTGPASGVIPITWIPDAKYKILIGKTWPFSFNDQKVWLKIIYDEIFEKDQKDIITQTVRDLNDGNFSDPKNIALSCLVTYQPEYNAIAFHYYIQRDLTGWKKIKSLFYVGFSGPDTHSRNIDSIKPFDQEVIKFKDLSSKEKGEIGESLGNIFARHLIIDQKNTFFPELDEDYIRIEHEHLRNTTDEYHTIITNLQGDTSLGTWNPDIMYHILSNSNPCDLIFEIYPKKLVWIEVKTGKNARFERSQELDMEHISQNLNIVVLFCNVLLDSSNLKLNIFFKHVQNTACRKELIQYTYTDF